MNIGTARRIVAFALVLAATLATASCGSVVREGRSPAYLVISNLTAASGAKPGQYSNALQSDVITLVKVGNATTPTYFEDVAQVVLTRSMKDVGTPASPVIPSANNDITITGYHVTFIRADGRNTPGVDVPYGFDGAITGTVQDAPLTLTFPLVRAQAKEEAPLKALQSGGGAILISTIAQVTFYGRDQTGNDVSVTGTISVNFGDWADPQ